MTKIYTIYFNPKDYPNKYVGRIHDTIFGPEDDCIVTDDIDHLRHIIISEGFENKINRSVWDDPCIVESWI